MMYERIPIFPGWTQYDLFVIVRGANGVRLAKQSNEKLEHRVIAYMIYTQRPLCKKYFMIKSNIVFYSLNFRI